MQTSTCSSSLNANNCRTAMNPHMRQQFNGRNFTATPPQNAPPPPFFHRGPCPGFFSPRPPGLTPTGTAPGVQGFVGLPRPNSGPWPPNRFMQRQQQRMPLPMSGRFQEPGMTPPKGNFSAVPRQSGPSRFTSPPHAVPRQSGPSRFTSPPHANFGYEHGPGEWHPNQHGHKNNKRKQQGFEGMPKKKPKVDKRDLSENNQYFCDCCDRGFKLEETFKEHQQGHIQCHIDGCSYVAAPKLVKMHVNMQHRSGLAKKIWQMESKDDVQKWISERKRCYPTAENIARKVKLVAERQSRGEVLENKSFGKMKQRGMNRSYGQHQDSRKNGFQESSMNSTDEFPNKEFKSKRHRRRKGQRQKNESNNGNVPFTGENQTDEEKLSAVQETSLKESGDMNTNATDSLNRKTKEQTRGTDTDPLAYALNENSSDSDEPSEKPATSLSVSDCKQLHLPGALDNLLTSYGDMSETEDDTPAHGSDRLPEQIKSPSKQCDNMTKQSIDGLEPSHNMQPESCSSLKSTVSPVKQGFNQVNGTDKSTPADQNTANQNRASPKKSPSSLTERGENGSVTSRKWQKHGRMQSTHNGTANSRTQQSAKSDLFYRPRPSLLEKLLAPEIRHERNVILQCVHYIVKNGFFGKGQQKSESSSSCKDTALQTALSPPDQPLVLSPANTSVQNVTSSGQVVSLSDS